MGDFQKIKLNSVICSTLFNVVEISIIILCGILMKVEIEKIIILFVLFFIARITSYKPMHYKSPILCMIWSTFVFCSFFLLTKVNLILAIVMTIFEGIILTGRGDIRDCFMYRKNENEQKYRELKRYVRMYKGTEKIKKFEYILQTINNKYSDRYKIDLYRMYILVFYEDMSFKKIKDEMNLRDDNHIIINALDLIFMSFNTYIETENLKELAIKS